MESKDYLSELWSVNVQICYEKTRSPL